MNYVVILAAKRIDNSISNIKDLPSCLCPFGGKTILDSLYEKYKNSNNNFIVVSYERYEMIKDYIQKKRYDIDVLVLDKLDSLFYSLEYFFRNKVMSSDDSVTLIYGDTIIDNTDDFSDAIYYSKIQNYTSRWTYFDWNDGRITAISDKAIVNPGYNNAFVGAFKFSNAMLLHKCMRQSKCDFYQSIMKYSQEKKMSFIEASNWFDMGHADNYVDSQMSVKSRTFNHIEIDKHRGILKKTSSELDKFKGEIEWYLKLPSDISYISPRIFGYSTDYCNMYIEMECYGYNTIHDLFLYGEFERFKWKKIFSNIHFIMNDMMKYSVKTSNGIEVLYEMYVKKTIDRLNLLRSNDLIADFFTNPIIVNDVKYDSLDKNIKKIDKLFKELFIKEDFFTIIHGDLCFPNMLIDDKLNFIKLIDPRGKFGNFDIYGDYRYDLAKLFHSVDGKYDYIIKDLFSITYHDNNITFKVNTSKNYEMIVEEFMEEFKDMIKGHIKQIYFIEAMLFFSMIPLHSESNKHQLAMLCTALQIFNKI